MHTTYIHEAGDTIVEVIICVAIIASILSGAFLVTSTSTRAVRDSEEHAQALQFLQGQVELLRADANIHGSLPAGLNSPFCLDSNGWYPAPSSSQCFVGSLYHMSIQGASSSPPPGQTMVFTFTATWNALTGAQDNVQLLYKVVVQ